MKFGIFDHLDASGQPLHAMYEDRLRLIERYDSAGFHAFHVAEHHATPLGMAPSPSVFLSAVAQRTENLRFGPAVYCLPLYHPIRLAEEICMLDQMSNGRLELGIGRGTSPIELGYYHVDADEAPDRYREYLDLLLALLQGASTSFQGKFFSINDMPFELDVVQKPYPPLWYGLLKPDSAAWPASQGINVLSNQPARVVAETTKIYWEAWREAGREGEQEPLIGMTRHVILAETDEAALNIARPAYLKWRASFVRLWERHGTSPIGMNLPETFDGLMESGMGIAGSPASVADRLAAQIEEAGVNYFLCRFCFGDMPFDDAARSLDLFVDRVRPELEGAETLTTVAG